MKTWQMIKELTENPNKKFRLKGEENIVYTDNIFEDGKIELKDVDFITIYDEWEEVKEPVTFMEVLQSKSPKVRVEHSRLDHKEYDFVNNYYLFDKIIRILASEFSYNLKDILLNGKWYIE